MLNEGYFDKIYYRFWQGEEVFANVFAIHGLGGHCVWFDNAGQLFNKNKINLFSFDLPGFGQSKYPKGTIDSYKTWINTTRETLGKFLQTRNVTAPVFILGHSMGALIAIMLAKSVRASGWIISVPGFEGYDKTWPFKNFILPVLLKSIFKPQENVVVPFGPELLTKNKETQAGVKKDPLRVVNLTANVYKEVYLLTQSTKMSIDNVKGPVLLLQAGKDSICSNVAMDEYFNKITLSDKSKKVYENSFHDLFIGDELEQIVTDITGWIKDHILQ